tara:strand:+ start:236 stop:409 length:174 start_codon:yes stop_codon:yes gene_type:complete
MSINKNFIIDEDKTYENEVRFNNDRLDDRKDRQNIKVNIPLELESTNSQEILQEQEE